VPVNPTGQGNTSMANDRGGSARPTTMVLEVEAVHDNPRDDGEAGDNVPSNSRTCSFKL
jgi:hypothetical protein